MNGFSRGVLSLVRTIHIYSTMLTVVLVLFFAATGFMLANSEWFKLEKAEQNQTLTLPAELLANPDQAVIEAKLRESLGAVGPRDSYVASEVKVKVVFKRRGMTTTAIIDRASGEAEVTKELRSTLSQLTELHKGGEGSRKLRYVLDAAAIVLAVACLTGILLCLIPPVRRRLGLATLVLGIAACVAAYYMLA